MKKVKVKTIVNNDDDYFEEKDAYHSKSLELLESLEQEYDDLSYYEDIKSSMSEW